MKLLLELLDLNQFLLFEDFGNLKDLKLGRMLNILKQRWNSGGGGRRNASEPDAEHIARKMPYGSSRGFGPNSEIVEVGQIKNWLGLKKIYDKLVKASEANESLAERNPPIGVALYHNERPVIFMLGNRENLFIDKKSAIMTSWDLRGVPSQIAQETISFLHRRNDRSLRINKNYIGDTDELVSRKSKTREKYNSKEEKYELTNPEHFEGSPQWQVEVRDAINKLCEIVITAKIILADTKSFTKRQGRESNSFASQYDHPTAGNFSSTQDKTGSKVEGRWSRGRPLLKSEISLFALSLKERLGKYKNSKIDDGGKDLNAFLDKVFKGELKKIKFAGITYNAVPKSVTHGSTHSHSKLSIEDKLTGRSYKQDRYFYSHTMQELLTGKTVHVEFDRDSAEENSYNSMELYIKLSSDRRLIPVKVKFSDATAPKKTEYDRREVTLTFDDNGNLHEIKQEKD